MFNTDFHYLTERPFFSSAAVSSPLLFCSDGVAYALCLVTPSDSMTPLTILYRYKFQVQEKKQL